MEKVTKTHLAHSIEKTVSESEYDDSIKALLVNKQVLARIAGHAVVGGKYDYLSISFIRLPKGNMEDSENKLIHMLSILFSETMDADTKKEILEKEYQMKMTKRLEGGIGSMCNVGRGLVEKGLQRGIIKTARKYGASDEEIIEQLMEELQVDRTEAEEYLQNEKQ